MLFGQYGCYGCIKFIFDLFWSYIKSDEVVIYLFFIIRKKVGCKNLIFFGNDFIKIIFMQVFIVEIIEQNGQNFYF